MTSLVNDGRPFLARSLAETGLSQTEWRDLVRDGLVRQVMRGSWVDARVEDGTVVRVQAAHLVAPPGAVFCDTTAAYLRGVQAGPPGRTDVLLPRCLVPLDDVRVRRDEIRCRRALVSARDVIEVDGLLLTSDVRTTCDLLRGMWRPHAMAAADAMAHAGLVVPEGVQEYAARLKGYRNIVQARELAYQIEPRSESLGESWQRLRVTDAGLPRPTAQVELYDRSGSVRARLDLAYVEAMVAMEYDGRRDHSDQVDRRRDEERREWVERVMSYRVVVARHDQVFGSDPTFERRVGALIGREPLARFW